MTTAYFEKAVRNGFGLMIPLGIRDDYDVRTSEVYRENDAAKVLERVWNRFQNIEPPHVCPDGGRSMMVGDLIGLQYADGSTGFFMVAAVGFTAVDTDWMHP